MASKNLALLTLLSSHHPDVLVSIGTTRHRPRFRAAVSLRVGVSLIPGFVSIESLSFGNSASGDRRFALLRRTAKFQIRLVADHIPLHP